MDTPKLPRPGFQWGKAERLRRHSQYCRVQSKGRRVGGKFLLVVFAPSSVSHVRYGITVSKRVGNAVTRNRVKRRLREILRRHKEGLARIDAVWIARPQAACASWQALLADAETILARVERMTPCPSQ